jgi:general bacterial porin, GBP family
LIYTVKLAALATLAATTGAFAQSSVTISGVLDYAAANVGGTQATTKGSTVSTTIGTSATSVIRFIAVEDLGGGMKATAQYNLDPRAIANDGSNTLGRDEVFMGLSGGFGNIRLGSPNSLTLATYLTASPLGTGVGSGYVGQEFGLTAGPRYNRSVRYDSPSFSGLTLSAIYAPGGDNTTTVQAASNGIPNAREQYELGAAYNNGPLNITLAHRAASASSNALETFCARPDNGQIVYGCTDAGAFAANSGTHAAAAYKKTGWTTIAANYKFGNTTVYAGYNDGETISGTVASNAVKTNGYRVGAKHDIGAISLIASYSLQEITGKKDVIFTGLRGDYALSKRTVAYVGYEAADLGGNVGAAKNSRNTTSVGVRHAF